MSDFLEICRLLRISPKDFFDDSQQLPILIQKINNDLKELDEKGIFLAEELTNRLKKQSGFKYFLY